MFQLRIRHKTTTTSCTTRIECIPRMRQSAESESCSSWASTRRASQQAPSEIEILSQKVSFQKKKISTSGDGKTERERGKKRKERPAALILLQRPKSASHTHWHYFSNDAFTNIQQIICDISLTERQTRQIAYGLSIIALTMKSLTYLFIYYITDRPNVVCIFA